MAAVTATIALAAGAPATAHPQLLFSASEIPALQVKIGAGTSQVAFDSMCGGIGWWDDWTYDPWLGRCLEEVAFRFSMTGDSWYANDVITELVWLASTDPAQSFDPENLSWAGAAPIPLATAYDLVFAELVAAQRATIVSHLERHGELLFEALADGARPALTSGEIMAYAGLGLLSIAIGDESSHPDIDAWREAAAEQLGSSAFRDAWNPGGSYDEGFGPSLSGTPEALRFAEAYRRATGQDLLAGTNVSEAADWYAYSWLPHAGHPAFGDPTYLAGQAFAAEHLLSIRRNNSELGKWAWHQIHGFSGIDALDRPAPVSGLLGAVLWYPEEVATIADPSSVGLLPDRWFHDTANEQAGEPGGELGAGGQLVMRNGWGYDSVALVLKVSDEWQPRSHNDSGSFVLSAFGAAMAMDPPAATLARRSGHNVVQVGERDDGAEPRSSYRGALGSLWSTSWAVTATADSRYPSGTFDPGDADNPTDDAWSPVDRALRTVVFVRSPRPYVFVADDVSADGWTAEAASWYLQLGQDSWGISGGSGEPFDPLRVEFYNGQQLLVSVLAPESGTLASVSYMQESPWHQRLSLQAEPRAEHRFLVMLQPRRWAGDPEQPWTSRLSVTGGVGAELTWSDGSDRLLLKSESAGAGAMDIAADGTSTNARLLLVRQAFGAEPTAWLAADTTRVVSRGLGLLDTGGLECSVSYDAGRLEVEASAPPEPLQIAVYAPFVGQVLLDGAPVSFRQAGNFVLLPAECEGEERCNRIDDDCDGLIDEDDAVDAPLWFLDDDGDGFGDPEQTTHACSAPAGYVTQAGDCNDADRHIYPGAEEDCSDIDDNDCNGRADEEDPACVEAAEQADTTMCTCSVVGLTRPPDQRPGPTRPGTTLVACALAAVLRRRSQRRAALRGGAHGARGASGAHGARAASRARGTRSEGAVGLGALVAILAGCGAPSSRTFAVTLTETGGVACVGQAVGLLADPVALEEAADELRREWKSAYESAVVRPEPRTLHVNELETRVQAWFELGADGCPPWAIAPEPINPGTPVDPYEQDASDSSSDLPAGDGICSAAAFAYDDSITVYEGEPQSDYVETSYVDAVNTDEADEAAELYPCGPRPVAQGVLSFTDQAGASGRVRWTHTHWIASEYSACEGRIDCVRNVALEGLEVE